MKKPIRLKAPQSHAFLRSSLVFSGTRYIPGDEEDYLGREARQSDLMADSLAIYTQILGDGVYHIPFALVFDLRNLVEYGYELPFNSGDHMDFDTTTRDRYSNGVLNRLIRESCFIKALQHINTFKVHGGDLHKNRAQRLTYLMVAKLAPYWPKHVVVNAAHVRGVDTAFPTDDVIVHGQNIWEQFADTKSSSLHLEEMLNTFMDNVLGVTTCDAGRLIWRNFVTEEDLFELENLEALDKAFLRYGVKRVLEVRSSIKRLDPSKVQLQEEESEAESNFLDDEHYQLGGISGISTKGNISNMLNTELAFLDEPVDEEGAFDLFTLRMGLNMSLYYTRDSGQCFRKRRKVLFVLDLSKPLNLKYPEHDFQMGTMASGFLLSFIRDIDVLFEGDSVIFELNIVGPNTEYVEEQTRIMELLLSAYVKRGLMEITRSKFVDLKEKGSKTRKTYGMVFSANEETIETLNNSRSRLKNMIAPVFPILINLSGKDLDLDGEDDVYVPLTKVELNPMRENILFKMMNIRQEI